MILIKNVSCFDGTGIVENASVLVSGSKIRSLTVGQPCDCGGADMVIDGKGKLLTPGFIDIHIHGCGGHDVMDGTTQAINAMAQIAAQNGTTSFLPTTVTMPPENTSRAVRAVKSSMAMRAGANILGVHLEGPFINKDRKGAQNEKYILKPSIPAFESIIGGELPMIKRVTLAPEIENCLELIRYLREKDICVSAGHTCASAEEFAEAVRAGVTLCTHLFNGMNPLHHRDPGIIAGAFLNDDIYTEFIPDLIHIDKDVLKLIVKIKGEDRCILITDALSAACLGDGIFDLGSQRVTVRDGIARTDSGSLAGSIIMLNRAVKNMVLKVGVDLKAVLKMVTVNPAKVIGVDGFKGMIREGYDADLNLLDENLDVVMSTVMGEVVQKAD